jgi:hypothetical protein
MVKILGSNAKLAKRPDGQIALVAGVSMAPAKRSGTNVCPHATKGCIAACVLWFAGRTVMEEVRQAAMARTRLWVDSPSVFFGMLFKELSALVRKATKLGAQAYVRLNVASDIKYPPEVFAKFPTISFYDYTKSARRAIEAGPMSTVPNYQLTYSVNEKSTLGDVESLLSNGVNVALVVDTEYCPQHGRYGALPGIVTFACNGETYSAKVVDGDLHDIRLREFDGQGVVVGLRLKGTLKSKESARKHGFAHWWKHEDLVRETPTIAKATRMVVVLGGVK